ncbi:MAG: DUF1631 family protein [Hydrogenophaga sp.]|uniref:DUF1631 family protein n=1 Tax=Hydrogenophaga sp. TaxID=1904254 RepID=UPI00275AE279|nr:DUF1631 family protein [Hydrogenophaga sp.]MDP2419040.1 DUF1631 family protein [Hydrogenophaga sp.]MDZ4190326.1 DUF1631 family protein [Hydrogenophaga sp.]
MSVPDPHVSPLAKQARERFVVHVGRALPELVKVCDARLTTIMDQPGSVKDMQARRDAWAAFQKSQALWLSQSRKALQRTLLPAFSNSGNTLSRPNRLELVAEGAIDDQIMASRLAMRVLDVASTELNALRLRVQHLEKRQEMLRNDVLLPDVTTRILVEQWLASQMSREAWALVQDALSPLLANTMLSAYKATNAFLVSSGVMEEIDLQTLVRRTPGAQTGRSADTKSEPVSRVPGPEGDVGSANKATAGSGAEAGGGWGPGRMGVHDETRLMTSATPLARARMRAQGVVGRLKRMFMERVGGDFEATQVSPPSPALEQVMQQSMAAGRAQAEVEADELSMQGALAPGVAYLDASHVERAATVLRERTTELKQAASTPTERATIEVVALMFQSILAEERIPPAMRVWFARLQIPVLRVALAEPEFFNTLHHPARQLIDRMGSCVMGFESNVGSAALETEIRRVVQVIEQYPETGRRVFQLLLDEFQKFLALYLSEKGTASKFVSVAQQVEQKETLSVQYTIELRKLLDGMSVRDEVRDFLFKVWADVLAMASVKYGMKHEETRALRQVASDLLWAASAKPNRNDRARVIQQLPGLLQRMRQGMGLLSYPVALQDQHIKSVSDTLADAFMSRAEAISQESLDHLSQRLASLEEYLPEGGMGDLDLDKDSIEMVTGVDASNIEVINQGGSQPNEAMRSWAAELQIGSWFGLDHNGKLDSVQFAWRSQRGQLYMFVANTGRCFLIQANRVASYLQAGLLVPSEEETLTVRATRDALAKLDANPERLLG